MTKTLDKPLAANDDDITPGNVACKKEPAMNIVLLTSGTVGTATKAAVGDAVTVTLHDENGNGITETGIVEEVLE